eukprot:scaffold38740_cov39-Phaeocystis_antarctica.AAC.1
MPSMAAWSKCHHLGSAPARLLCLLRGRLAALSSSNTSRKRPARWAPSHCPGCSSEPPTKPPNSPPVRHDPGTTRSSSQAGYPRLCRWPGAPSYSAPRARAPSNPNPNPNPDPDPNPNPNPNPNPDPDPNPNPNQA